MDLTTAPPDVCPEWCRHCVPPLTEEDPYRHYGPRHRVGRRVAIFVQQSCFADSEPTRRDSSIDIVDEYRSGFGLSAHEARLFAKFLTDGSAQRATSARPCRLGLAETPTSPVDIYGVDGRSGAVIVAHDGHELFELTVAEAQQLGQLVDELAMAL